MEDKKTEATDKGAPQKDEFKTLTEEEAMAYLEEVDKESQTRSVIGIVKQVFYFACIAVSLYHLYTAFAGTPPVIMHRSLHAGSMLALGFILYPIGKKASRKKVAFYDWIFCGLALAIPFYIWFNYLEIIGRSGMPNMWDTIMTTILVILTLEAGRRMTGLALPILGIIFMLYAFIGPRGYFHFSLPGLFGHRGYTWSQLADTLLGTEGILGTSVSVAASYIFLFILFGAVMQKSGMGQFFNDLAMSIAGSAKGGPAKVSVIASALLGSVNGSAIANVVTTGAFTIPLMKKTGYSKEFAGAVESSASVGGQILPPVMGAAAFIMAEMLGVSYSKVIVWAVIPALLYYLGIIIQVHLRAEKNNLLGVPRSQLPKTRDIMREKGHLLLPILFLLDMLFFSGTTVIFSAFWTILATIVVSWLRPSTRMGFKAILDALADGARQTVSVAVACICVGIIVGVFAKTGFGLSMTNAIVRLGSTSLLLTLVFTMVACIILGMGVPSIPAYIITATIAARALSELGVQAPAAHLFSFYFAMFANLTPPVALAAFAAAGLSGGDPMKTGWQSVKLSIAGFIVPFMFVYSPALMLIDTTFLHGVQVAVTASIGVFLIGASVEGFLFTRMMWPLRILAFGGALGLIDPALVTDLIGLVVLAIVILVQRMVFKKEKAAKALQSG
jgi:TRAP transporter 4TM/12TM fusion protein